MLKSLKFVSITPLLLALACAPAGTASTGGGSSTLITQEQIRASNYATANDVVRAIRPNWLNVRGTGSFGTDVPIQVYLDNSRLGGIEALNEINASTLAYIEWFDSNRAASRWGLDHGNGAIYLSTRPR